MLFLFTIFICWGLKIVNAQIQDVNIVLSQGTIVGLKVFPETSRIPVYTYHGIPYAKPPLNELRFTPPIPSPGWNRTLFARDFKPICHQIENNSYEEIGGSDGISYRHRKSSEDCLYLNIWMPETAIRYGGFPVLVMVTGEEMAFDWLHNRPTGLDLASEGIIVVSVQYRTNIFGWFSLGAKDAPGNLGLLDQQLALLWIKDNIQKFGGDTNRITLLGHGSTGAPNAMVHLISPKSRGLFSKVILMSGSIYSPYSEVNHDLSLSNELIQILSCDSKMEKSVLQCMQQKSVHDLLKAYEVIFKNGNYTKIIGPVIDDYLDSTDQVIPDDPRSLFASKTFINQDIPIMMGLTSNEGAFLQDKYVEFGKQGPDALKKFVDNTLLPNVLAQMKFSLVGQNQIKEAINWKFFDQTPETSAHYLNSLQKLISETRFEIPFFETLEILTNSHNESEIVLDNLFVYLFHHSNSMDMRGKTNYFGGASHSSELPFLLGPSLYQEIGRRRFSQAEDKLCKKIRGFFAEFIKTGNPTPGRLFDSWHPYTPTRKYIKMISSKSESLFSMDKHNLEHIFEQNLSQIDEYLFKMESDDDQMMNNNLSNPYDLSSRNKDEENSRTSKNAVYMDNKNSEYFYYLKRMHSFWDDFLPKLSQIMNETDQIFKKERSEEEPDLFLEQSPKYKHAFFSMLTLVCLLLAILCVCVYILRKNSNKSLTSIL